MSDFADRAFNCIFSGDLAISLPLPFNLVKNVKNKISQAKISARVIFNFLAEAFKTLGEAGFLPR